MRWRTVDGIQTEERADTPLGSYVVQVSQSGRWGWCGPDTDWGFCDTSGEAKRAAQRHFYAECAGRLARGPFCCSTEAAIEETLAALGIEPEREPLLFFHPPNDNNLIANIEGGGHVYRYLIVNLPLKTHAAYSVSDVSVNCLLAAGSFEACKAACERDREASCR